MSDDVREHPLPGNALGYVAEFGDGSDRPETVLDVRRPDSIEKANVVTSIDEGEFYGEPMHRPVLDVDFPCKVIESSTPGHSHLFIDRPMSWATYSELIDALAKAGIIERGYANAVQARGLSAVRLPWVKKPVPAAQSLAPAVATKTAPWDMPLKDAF